MLGRTGVGSSKREGDGATPAGRFPLRRVMFRQDRVAIPLTALATAPIAPDDGWCDDPADPMYNRPVKLPYRASAEQLWREDNLYDIVAVIGHNDHPVIPGAGSAIFMHLADPRGAPTAGCVAMNLEDLRTLLRVVDAAAVIDIQPAR
jgi:L,D-peptidoglycan transpeptidase YkuD (ErfK/YbiS/YcfS/YnhG family)